MRRMSLRTSVLAWLSVFFFACLPARSHSQPSDLASYDDLIEPAHRKHWAFQPVHRPAIPAVRNRAWLRNAIDAFVLAKPDRPWAAPMNWACERSRIALTSLISTRRSYT